MLDYKIIGRRISFYRKKNSLTQAVLAEEMGISEGYLSQIERGSAKISLYRLNQIAEILKIDVAVLISNSSKQSESFCNSEISEIIKNWTPDQISLLLKILLCVNDSFTDN